MLNSSVYLALVNLSSNIIGFICAVKSNVMVFPEKLRPEERERRQMQVRPCVYSLYWKKQQRTTKGSNFMSHVEMHSVSVIILYKYCIFSCQSQKCSMPERQDTFLSQYEASMWFFSFFFSFIQV